MVVFGHRLVAADSLDEQAGEPELTRCRDLRPGQPLPPDLGPFDTDGRAANPLPRAALVQLRRRLDNDGQVLARHFPEGLAEANEPDLRGQLDTLHHHEWYPGMPGQPWSPKAYVDAVLAEWPGDQPW